MKSSPWILGISASHNGAVCLLKGDEIVAAVQEERLSRRKRDEITGAQPSLALAYCLDYARIKPGDLDLVVCCVTGRANTDRHDLSRNPLLQTALHGTPTLRIPHHYGHAVSSVATSGYRESAVLVIDGAGSPFEDIFEQERAVCVGEVEERFEISSLYAAAGTELTPLEKHFGDWIAPAADRMPRFGSLGSMYAAVAGQIFGDINDAGKVMGLAPYGRATTPDRDFFDIADRQFVFHDTVPNRFQHGDRWPWRRTEYEDLACSTQAALEKGVLHLVNRLYDLCPSKYLCYSGGVALNSVANERIVRESRFEKIYFMPAAEDSGAAIGAAFYGLWQLGGGAARKRLRHDAVGRPYSGAAIADAIDKAPGVEVVPCEDVLAETAGLLDEGRILGWFQGRSELGPRALGQRSIICDPRRADGKEVLNRRVKHREGFRPFAPVVLLEEAKNWFDIDGQEPESPFMLRVCKFKEQKQAAVPAVVHVDGTGRYQTVTKEANGRFYELVKAFYERTGVPIILNTSFNVMGEPIVETPADALLCFQATGIDYCVLEGWLVKKRNDILFGGSDTYWYDRVRDDVARAVTAASTPARERDLASRMSRPPAAYEGAFEHPARGKVTIASEQGRLRWVLRSGQTLPLEEQPRRGVFRVDDPRYGHMLFAFPPSRKGNVDCLAVVRMRRGDMADMRLFTRMPAAGPVPAEALRCAGEYEGEHGSMTVSLNREQIPVAAVRGQRGFELVHHQNLEFGLRYLPGYHIEFRADGASVMGAVVTQPGGVYTLRRTSG